jgi:hypothetical protein
MAPKIQNDLRLEGQLVELRPPFPEDDEQMSAIFRDEKTMEHLQLIIPEGGFTKEFIGNWRELFIKQVCSSSHSYFPHSYFIFYILYFIFYFLYYSLYFSLSIYLCIYLFH